MSPVSPESPESAVSPESPESPVPFGTRLREAMDRRGALCAGIDPHPGLLRQWGLPDTAEGLDRFAMGAVEALAPLCAAVKPQSAFFERFGSRGIAVLERVVSAARAAGALVVLDVKRGDIGSTSQAYADAYLEPGSPLLVDAVTASPFLGLGSLDPMIETALAHGGGVFVLALTSNPEGARIQRARTGADPGDGAGRETGPRTVAGTVLAGVARRNAGARPLGSLGVVVGATVDPAPENPDVNGPLLVPGVGAQGAGLDDVRRRLGAVLPNVLVAISREILAAGPASGALESAALRSRDAVAGLTR